MEFDAYSALNDFHWQRPVWLWGIVIAVLAVWYLVRGHAQNNNWKSVINAQLLPHLLQGSMSKQQIWPLVTMAVALVIAFIAMAGPSWEKLPQPIHKTESALVILLDLSPSMMAEDIKPSRLVRARLKLVDLLNRRQEGLAALIVYAGEAYTVTPLTDDNDTIISLLPSLSPDIMPLNGSNPEMALDQAIRLFKDGGLLEGDILLVTDGVAGDALDYLSDELPAGFRLSVLGVGTDNGAPIPINNGGFAKDRSGAIVLAKLNSGELSQLARNSGGLYRTLSSNDSDIAALVKQPELLNEKTRQLEREFDTWIDRGAWLPLLLIPFVAMAFRRGWLLIIPFLLITPEKSYASSWQDLWKTKDQQAQELLLQNKPAQAAETFTRPDWKAAAQYRAQDFTGAAEHFAEDPTPTGHYNRGNALAKAGKLKEAIEAYDQALTEQPELEDATANKALVEKLLQQKQEQEQQQKSESSDQNNDSDGQDSQEQKSQSDQSSDDQQDSSQSDSNQDSSDSESSQQKTTSDQEQSDDSESEQQPSKQDEQSQKDDKTQAANQQQSAQPGEQDDSEANQAQSDQQSELTDEQQQAMEQWLRKIPDDPSGLIRKKFEYQYRQRRQQYQQGTWQPPENDANNRW